MINKCLKKSTSTELKIAIETLMDFLNGIRKRSRMKVSTWVENYFLKNLRQASIKGNFSWNL